MFVPIGQFAPDSDQTQGNFLDVLNVIGTSKGYKGAPTVSNTGVSALASACTGGALVKNVEGASTVYAGTATKLYKLSSTSWDDVSRAGDYTASYRWRFAQFGNVTIAASRGVATQSFENGATDFADLAGAPKARIVETVNDFVFLFGTNEGTYGDEADRWWCSALGDHTDWTPAIATQCATGRLYDAPGAITAGKRLGDYITVFKESAIYIGSYVGPSSIWNWIRVTDAIGASCQEAVQNIGQALLFCNRDGFHMFDGTQVQTISEGKVSEWWRSKVDANNIVNVQSITDRNTKTVYWFFPVSGGDGTLSAWVSYHWPSGKFGYGEQSIEAALAYASPAMDYVGLNARYPTYADLPDVSFDAVMFLGGTEAPALFTTSHVLSTFDGNSASATITTGDIGQDGTMMLLSRVRNRYLSAPASASLTNYYADQLGSTFTEDATTTETSGKFDLLRTARWHRLKLQVSGNFELSGADVTLIGDGLE